MPFGGNVFQRGHDTHHGHLPGNVIVKPLEDVNLTHDAAHHTFGHGAHHESGNASAVKAAKVESAGVGGQTVGAHAWRVFQHEWGPANPMERYRPPPVEVGPEREYTLHRSQWPTTVFNAYDVSGYTIHDNMNLLNTHARAWNHPSQQPLDYVFTPQSFYWDGQQTYTADVMIPPNYTYEELQLGLHHFQVPADELPDWGGQL